MHLLIAAPLGVYKFDVVSGELSLVTNSGGEYYGLTWDDSSVFIANSNVDNALMTTEADFRNRNNGCVVRRNGNVKEIELSGLSIPHQMIIDSLGRLIVVNTGLNCLSVKDLRNGTDFNVYLNNVDCEVIGGVKVGNHFNSVYEHESSIYVMAHNFENKSSVWELDLETLALKQEHLTRADWAHNIWKCEHGTIICDSKNASLLDVGSKKTIWRNDGGEPLIARGLAASKDHVFVGISEFGDRVSRKISDGGFWVIDRKTLKTIDVRRFKNTGCVNEIRLVGSIDYCHNAPMLPDERLCEFADGRITGMLSKWTRFARYRLKEMLTR